MVTLKAVGIATIIGSCFIAELVGAALTLRVQLHSYRNRLSQDAQGRPCDPLGTSECENEFEFCLKRRSSTTCLYRITSSGHYEDDDFTFTPSIASRLGISNPLEFVDVPDEPLRLEITIEDDDSLSPDDLVDIITVNVFSPSTILDGGFTLPQFHFGGFSVSRIELSFQVTNSTIAPTPQATDLPVILGSVVGTIILLLVAGFVVCVCCCCIYADCL